MVTRFDPKGFITSFRLYRHAAIHDIFFRYILSKIFMKTSSYSRGAKPWNNLFIELMHERFFVLIILASVRYDAFRLVNNSLFKGNLIKARSPCTYTKGWLKETLKIVHKLEPSNNVRIFHNPVPLYPHNWILKDEVTHLTNDYVMLDYGTITNPRTPNAVLNEILSIGLKDKNIIYLMNTHFPWHVNMELSSKLFRDAVLFEFIPNRIIKNTLLKYGISDKEVAKTYLLNILEVLKAINFFLRELDRKYKVVITSDHGELLGEYGLYLHPHYRFPQLCIVPWLRVEEGGSR